MAKSQVRMTEQNSAKAQYDVNCWIDRYLCRHSYYEFLSEAWKIIEPSTPLQANWHIQRIAGKLQEAVERLERGEEAINLVINVPPGTTKSTLVPKMLPAWVWTRSPSLKVVIATYESTLATNHALKARDIMTSEWYRRCWGDMFRLKVDKNVKTEYENSRSGTVITTSVGGTVIGKHADIIIIDDPNNPNVSVDRKELEDVNSWHDQVLSTRMTDKKTSVKIIVMQRIAQGDLSEYVLSKTDEQWEHICLPAEEDENISPKDWRSYYQNGLLDPHRLGREALKRMMSNLGSMGYAGQIQQRPTVAEGNILHRDWFRYDTMDNFENRRNGDAVTFFLDTAYTEKNNNDPSGIIATCKLGNMLYILNAEKVRMEFPDLVRWVQRYAMKNGYDNQSSIRIEPKANGLSLIQQLKENTSLNITQTPSPKESKEVRMNAAAPAVESGRIVLVKGNWNKDFIDEVCGFPGMKHDEYADLLCYAVNHHLKGNTKSLRSIASQLH